MLILTVMETKLKSLIGRTEVALFILEEGDWIEGVTIQKVEKGTVVFLWVDDEDETWERTVRIDSISQVDVKVAPLSTDDLDLLKEKLNKTFSI